MKRLVASWFMLLVGLGPASGDELTWRSFDEALQLATEEGKPFLVDFYTDWCHWCKVMDEKTFRDEEVAGILDGDFVVSRIHAEDGNATLHYRGITYTNIEFTRAMRISGFPSLAFFDSGGDPITVIPGFIEPDMFQHILAYVRDGCYKQKMTFQEFMDRKGECDEE
jgi:thioredoxin-related protein